MLELCLNIGAEFPFLTAAAYSQSPSISLTAFLFFLYNCSIIDLCFLDFFWLLPQRIPVMKFLRRVP